MTDYNRWFTASPAMHGNDALGCYKDLETAVNAAIRWDAKHRAAFPECRCTGSRVCDAEARKNYEHSFGVFTVIVCAVKYSADQDDSHTRDE